MASFERNTLFQALQLFVVIASILWQYYWFVENRSPLELFDIAKQKLLHTLAENEFEPTASATQEQSEQSQTINIAANGNSNNEKISNELLSHLIHSEFEETLHYFEYSDYPSKKTMYLQFWKLFFESLSNDSHSFRHKTWQSNPVLLDRMTETFARFAPHNYERNTDFVSKLLDLNTVISTLSKNGIYESPFALFFHSKLKSVSMDLNEWKANEAQKRYFTKEYLFHKLGTDTLVINNAGLVFKNIALFEQILMNALHIPINTNAYVSGQSSGEYSSQIHNDRQDLFIVQTQGRKRWQVWEPNIRNPRFEQIRGKGENSVSETEIANLNLLFDVTLSSGDILYIPKGYLHQITTVNDGEHSIHLSMGAEIATLGFTMEAFMFCAMGMHFKSDGNVDIEEKLKNHSILTWLSAYLWQWTFMNEETRKVFPFFELSNAHTSDDIHAFQQSLYRKTLSLIEAFEIALTHTKGIDAETLTENRVPKVNETDLKLAHNIFNNGWMRLKDLFLAKLSLQRDAQFTDVLDRNSKFEELMLHEVTTVYQKCGVPVDIVGDGFTFKQKE